MRALMTASGWLILAVACFTAAQADEFNNFNVCGKANLESKIQRIVGGADAKLGDLPWQAAVRNADSPSNRLPFCGATLISKRWAISAAHCGPIGASHELVFGANDFSSSTEGTRQVKKVKKSIMHEGYNANTFQNDILLIELEEEVTINDYVKPACIIGPNEELDGGTEVVISGWGTIQSDGQQSNILQEAKVNIVTNQECDKQYGGGITSAMLCAAAPGKDSCQGDSGGPLVYDKCKNDQFFLAGVVSFGIGCAKEGFSGVYADVSTLRAWVVKKLSENDVKAASTPEPTCGTGPITPSTTTTTVNPGAKADEFNDFNICGKANLESKIQRIVGGADAKLGDLPWQAAVRNADSPSNRLPFCGATLISKRWAISAAHCGPMDARHELVFGANDFSSSTEGTRQVKKVKKSIMHEGYNEDTLRNDILLIELEEEVTINDYVKPACIIGPNEELDGGTEVVISGWGTIQSDGQQSNILQEAKVDIVTNQKCNEQYGGGITSEMLCAAAPGKDSCEGDSGGPLVHDKCKNDQFFLAGVVSWGIGCAKEGFSGVYADVSTLRAWVVKKLSENGVEAASTPEPTCGTTSTTTTTTKTTPSTTTTTTTPTTTLTPYLCEFDTEGDFPCDRSDFSYLNMVKVYDDGYKDTMNRCFWWVAQANCHRNRYKNYCKSACDNYEGAYSMESRFSKRNVQLRYLVDRSTVCNEASEFEHFCVRATYKRSSLTAHVPQIYGKKGQSEQLEGTLENTFEFNCEKNKVINFWLQIIARRMSSTQIGDKITFKKVEMIDGKCEDNKRR